MGFNRAKLTLNPLVDRGEHMLPQQIFLLGAGFNADATAEVGPLFGNSIDCGYPLVADALRVCFDRRKPATNQSIEDLFSEALERREYSPIEELAHCLMKADYYLAFHLASTQPNCYGNFVRAFDGSHFLTLNYDSLPETMLFHMERWYPHDGYGIPVQAELPPGKESKFADRKSTSLVLHLHGSLCVKTSGFHIVHKPGSSIGWLEKRERSCFSFDPVSIGPLFAPFRRRPGDFDVKDRIIAPVRDKSQGLTRDFVCAVYERAVKLVRHSGSLVSIGYSFNNHDRQSYEPILSALGDSEDKRLTVVSPEARKLADKLRREFPSVNVVPIEATFKEWSDQEFPFQRAQSRTTEGEVGLSTEWTVP